MQYNIVFWALGHHFSATTLFFDRYDISFVCSQLLAVSTQLLAVSTQLLAVSTQFLAVPDSIFGSFTLLSYFNFEWSRRKCSLEKALKFYLKSCYEPCKPFVFIPLSNIIVSYAPKCVEPINTYLKFISFPNFQNV